MGLFGLRRFIDSAGVTHLLPVPPIEGEEGKEDLRQEDGDQESSAAAADHVLIDLNCIVHACFSARFPSSSSPSSSSSIGCCTKEEIIRRVLYRLEILLTRVVVPRKSLTICLDGPAPLAKLQTQRLRRRKVSLMDSAGSSSSGMSGGKKSASVVLNALAVTAGSLFMVELENAIAELFKERQGKGFLPHCCPVFLHGTTVMGEGECKISRALMYLAYGRGDNAHRQNGECRNNGPPPYDPNDTVVILGNDIDLVMTCLGATFYHNIFVVSPASLQCISVSDMLYRWVIASQNTSNNNMGDGGSLTLEDLPALRIDFIFLFLLNGGDHYVGAGDVAMALWQRYKTIRHSKIHKRKNSGSFSLVSPSLDRINVNVLSDILQAEDYTGEADAEVGLTLLRSALWSLYTTVTGICPDYRYIPSGASNSSNGRSSPEDFSTTSPTLSHLRAAAALCRKKKQPIYFPYVPHSAPLTPLEHFVALMPTVAALPKGVASTLQGQFSSSSSLRKTSFVLLNSNDPTEVAAAAEQAVEASRTALRQSESYLCQFTAPVQLNVLPPRPRISRHEHHRRLFLARKANPHLSAHQLDLTLPEDDPPPVVRVIRLVPSLTTPSGREDGRTAFSDVPADNEALPPIVDLTYPAKVKGLTFHSPFDEELRPSSCPPTPGTRKFIPFHSGLGSRTHQAEATDSALGAQLKTSLEVAQRLRESGHAGAAEGKKMKKRLRKAEAALQRAVVEGAAEDDSQHMINVKKEVSKVSGVKRGREMESEKTVEENDNDKEKEVDDWAFHASISKFLGNQKKALDFVFREDEPVSDLDEGGNDNPKNNTYDTHKESRSRKRQHQTVSTNREKVSKKIRTDK